MDATEIGITINGMLSQLTLTNIAVFEAVTLPVSTGLTVLLGEAGSGKSLLLDALDWVFGEPSSPRDVIRYGCDTGQVEVTVQLPDSPALQSWLQDNDCPDATVNHQGWVELTIRRHFALPATSRSRVNGVVVSRRALEQLRPLVLDMQTQHAAMQLFQPACQRQLLDASAGPALMPLRQAVEHQFRQWQALRREYDTLLANKQHRLRERDFLAYQQQELAAAQLHSPTEDSDCKAALERLAHAEQLQKSYAQAQQALTGQDGGWGADPPPGAAGPAAVDALGQVTRILRKMVTLDPRLQEPLATLDALQEELTSLSATLTQLSDTIESDPQELDRLSDRLALLEGLKRKYGPTLADVMTFQHQVETQFSEQDTLDEREAALAQDLETSETALRKALDALSEARGQAAEALQQQVLPLLHALRLPNAVFQVVLSPTPTEWSVHGQETVQFLFSANPGEPARALDKVASGGELSRLMLALQVVQSRQRPHPVMLVFDEIDTGTSGQVARAIAQQLRALTQHQHQVLVVTHQPIVAAAADTLWWVEKRTIDDEHSETARAVSQVQVLRRLSERKKAIGWLASGVDTQLEGSGLDRFVDSLMAQVIAS